MTNTITPHASVHPIHPKPHGALLVDLMTTRDAVKDLYRACLASYGLTEQQWRVLSALWFETRLDATRLAERSAVLPSSLTRIMTALEARGLVVSRRDPDDARRTELRLSAAGKTLMLELAPDIQKIESRIAHSIGAARLEALLRALQHTRTALQDGAEPAGLHVFRTSQRV
jgi:homoprotocatechuate degradation regulator HpaR